jgi:ribosome biogenesis protein MAK21
LKEKPEQESNLLRLLINKLGDPSKKIASRASYLLLQLQQAHPLMKATIISAIEAELLFRPGQSKHAQYYGVITLNQTVLSSSEEKVAAQLLDIYFALFVSLLKSKDKPQDEKPKDPAKQKGGKRRNRHSSAPSNNQDEELREKLISGVLAGVNRAYPFTTSNTERYVYLLLWCGGSELI